MYEYCRLFNFEHDILRIRLYKYQHLQSLVDQERLLTRLRNKMRQVVNKVGCDLNFAFQFDHTQAVMQFVSGLGPRKARQLIDDMLRCNEVFSWEISSLHHADCVCKISHPSSFVDISYSCHHFVCAASFVESRCPAGAGDGWRSRVPECVSLFVRHQRR